MWLLSKGWHLVTSRGITAVLSMTSRHLPWSHRRAIYADGGWSKVRILRGDVTAREVSEITAGADVRQFTRSVSEVGRPNDRPYRPFDQWLPFPMDGRDAFWWNVLALGISELTGPHCMRWGIRMRSEKLPRSIPEMLCHPKWLQVCGGLYKISARRLDRFQIPHLPFFFALSMS